MKLIKVCGMRELENIRYLEELKPDFMGFIFYPKSPRFVGEFPNVPELNVPKVGVFVNETVENVLRFTADFKLDYVQLHGNETAEYCHEIKQHDVKILKAFAVDDKFDFEQLMAFETVVDYFLFDTKGDGYGGHGTTFDWKILDKYTIDTPFFIAGGVSNDNIGLLLKYPHPMFRGVDVNSKYEISAGLKDIEALKELFLNVRK